ncbi:MAG: hypothetical protein GEEBNDBF_01394 [bacterium]|nr:hypothetical protein [bacterium]
MTLVATTSTRWWLVSLIQHLATALPDLTVVPGPPPATPSSLPLLVLEERSRQWEPCLGQRVSSVLNEQGGWLQLTCDVTLLTAAGVWQEPVREWWDALQQACAVGMLPLLLPQDPDDVHSDLIQRGTLLLHLERQGQAGDRRAQPMTPSSGPWAHCVGRLVLQGPSWWLEGDV